MCIQNKQNLCTLSNIFDNFIGKKKNSNCKYYLLTIPH